VRGLGQSLVVRAECRTERIQAWREENELAGRTLVRGGAWLI